jgi:5'-nucleotidase
VKKLWRIEKGGNAPRGIHTSEARLDRKNLGQARPIQKGGNMRVKMLMPLMLIVALVAIPDRAESLSILLTNDDGITTPGLQTVKNALRAAGHDVLVVAPDGAQSGSSAAVTLASIVLTEVGENEFSAADTEPASCIGVGLALLAEKDMVPDLVISGTNDGANIGAATPVSGTVGGAIAAISLIVGGSSIPAIAISTDPPDGVDEDENPMEFEAHFANVADFLVELVTFIEGAPLGEDGALLPLGTALTVNYPPLAPEEIAGISSNVQGRTYPGLTLAYVRDAEDPNTFGVSLPDPGPQEEVPGADATAFGDGYITIVPIEANYTVDRKTRLRIEAGLSGFTGRDDSGPMGVFESPMPNSFQSGLGVISGWVCAADEVLITLNGEPQPAAYGTERLDTESVCGDTDNGFGVLFNWNRLGDGEHTVVAWVDDEELGRATVQVTTLGQEFVRGAEGECVVDDFPLPGETVTLEWQQNQQNFVITDGE